MKDSKKVFSTRINNKIIKSLKHLSVDTERSLGDLLEEAIDDLINKYQNNRSGKQIPE